MDMKELLIILAGLISVCLVNYCHTKSKYYDGEIRPYNFGYSIEGHQHRHEEKDEKGQIMGEFGFVTGDGVYHVTGYATDEDGNFRILYMRNIKIGLPGEQDSKPAPKSMKQVPAAGSRRVEVPTSEIVKTTAAVIPPLLPAGVRSVKKPDFEVKIIRPEPSSIPACSSCVIPEKAVGTINSKQAVNLPSINKSYGNNKSTTQIDKHPQNNKKLFQPLSQSLNESKQLGQKIVSKKPHAINSAANSNLRINGLPLTKGPQTKAKTTHSSSSGNSKKFIKNEGPVAFDVRQNEGVRNTANGESVRPSERNRSQANLRQSIHVDISRNQERFNNANPLELEGPSPADGQLKTAGGSDTVKSFNSAGTSDPRARSGLTKSTSPSSTNQLISRSNDPSTMSKSAILQSPTPLPVKQSPVKASNAGNPAIPQRSTTDRKNPGQTTGFQLIDGILYKYNYTVGYHGHHEQGDRQGAKDGGYYFIGRDGIRRTVEYTANEFGYQPHIKLGPVEPQDVPREETEKNAGLKGFEFKWFNAL